MREEDSSTPYLQGSVWLNISMYKGNSSYFKVITSQLWEVLNIDICTYYHIPDRYGFIHIHPTEDTLNSCLTEGAG